jgi:hypothetical protein
VREREGRRQVSVAMLLYERRTRLGSRVGDDCDDLILVGDEVFQCCLGQDFITRY